MLSDLTLDPSFKVKWGEPKLKVLITRLLSVLEVWDGKPTYRKSWAGNLLVWSDLTLGLCGHFRDLKVTLKLKLQPSNFPTDRIHVEVISNTV